MDVVLVLAGNHAQFLGWMRNVYGSRGRPGSAPRSINSPEHFWGIHAEDVGAFHQVGTYWDNPVWGSDEYAQFMRMGCALGKAWAMSHAEDWAKAAMLRDPLTPEEFDASRQRLLALVTELANGD